jgi:hypothetical protein
VKGDAKRTVGEPHDRLTRLCDAMTETLVAHEEYADDVKCIVFLDDDERGGLVLHGYDDDTEALANLFMHLKAIFNAQGKDLVFAPLLRG